MKRSSSSAFVCVFFVWLSLSGSCLGRLNAGSPTGFLSGPSFLKSGRSRSSVSSSFSAPRRASQLYASEDDESPNWMGALGKLALLGAGAAALGSDMGAPSPALAVDRELRSYTQFLDLVEKDKIKEVTFSSTGTSLVAEDSEGNKLSLQGSFQTPELYRSLRTHKVEYSVEAPPPINVNVITNLLLNIAPWVVIGGFFFLLSRQVGQMGDNPFQEMGKFTGKLDLVPQTGVNFTQVAGQDEAKLELQEIVTFLKTPEQFTRIGAKVPRGVIMEGPPGTGKTLMAKAVAGEAGVAFLSTSGSSFIEVFGGLGAARVRDLFKEAKKNAPCIVFIDEIDSIGRKRAQEGIMSGSEEREATLNQLLSEMDGFEQNQSIVVIAATNRADVLDEALLRPGRFDRRVQVILPDYPARLAILKVHAKGKPLAEDVDLDSIARISVGFSGASLENLMNEAAIFAARANKDAIENSDVEAAFDRITLGTLNKAQRSETRSLQVAYHEAGHALTAVLAKAATVQKISIVSRGGAGGITRFAPSEDQLSGLVSKDWIMNQIVIALGGRAAEEVVYGGGEVTTGASNDLEQVARLTRSMVLQYGFIPEIGALNQEDMAYMRSGGAPYLEVSEATRRKVDLKVREIADAAYARSKKLLADNRALLDEVAKKLVEEEVIDGPDFGKMVSDYQIAFGKSEAKPLVAAVA
uniref:AAA+ ATPase domain-containing protein n=1 Tax=Chromera velia CCMP2878 TaxID=1169474 RepID=A0A0G4IDV1_9ALVE|mmetsp:Transcript_6309/g.12494  ORF Transcript_6309/g.12494 Transcript_6309/m.12494 type:complete len:694 (-) Transcript_6309:1241-3322(-)|eukprot:Cvel_13399.t1-p1 / transcript=Cvel_13399.t1 / gene=Cvel_13399 / organism=Chromera_velia_CCMP2878 / gene_product=ATP-dependent zinc metalloprotease FtsH 3, putative / transcript_product=ATP-dependent zinc metalloprotease FtsH 3, putative / location=Cvel_scaffold913:9790-14289(-) / protein_length=693 / sequence_SO=supercontig / SO=protein_coding / is_pseudo=false